MHARHNVPCCVPADVPALLPPSRRGERSGLYSSSSSDSRRFFLSAPWPVFLSARGEAGRGLGVVPVHEHVCVGA